MEESITKNNIITIGLLCIISVLSLQRSYLSYLSCLDLFSYKLLKDFNFNQEDMHFYLFFYFTWSWKQWTYHLLIRFVKIVYWDKKKSISEFSSHLKQSSSPFINTCFRSWTPYRNETTDLKQLNLLIDISTTNAATNSMLF